MDWKERFFETELEIWFSNVRFLYDFSRNPVQIRNFARFRDKPCFFFFFFPYKFPYFWSIWSRDSNVKITSLSNRNELIYRRFDDIIFRIKKFEEAFRFITKKIKAKVKIRFRTLVAYDRYKFSKELQTITKNNVLFVLITCSIENSR